MERLPLRFKVNCSSGWPFIALGVIALVGGLFHRNAGAVGIGLTFIGGPVIAYFLVRHAIRGITFRRIAPDSAFEGDTVEIRVRLENHSLLPVFHPLVCDCFAPELHARKDVLFADRLLPGEAVEERYHGACILPRGIYSLGPMSVTVSDPFGWFQAHKVLREGGEFKVYPAVQRFGTKDELGRCFSQIVSELVQRSVGDSKDYVWVREYQRGDPLRNIHWGLTAHRGQHVVREFASNAAGDMNIFVDRSREALIGIGRASSMEHSVKIAAAFAAHSLSRGHRVQLAAGTEPGFHVPPAAHAEQMHSVLEVLVRVKPHDTDSLPLVLERFGPRIRPGATAVVMISPYLYENAGLEQQLRQWKLEGVRVVAVVFDAASFRRLLSHTFSETDSQDYVNRLSASGIRAHLLPCAADFRAVLAGDGR